MAFRPSLVGPFRPSLVAPFLPSLVDAFPLAETSFVESVVELLVAEQGPL